MSSNQTCVVDGLDLNLIFTGLKSNLEEQRGQYATELELYLQRISQDFSLEQFNRYTNEINKSVFELLHSKKSCEILGGILALNVLIDFDSGIGEENVTKTSRFSNYLGSLILSNDDVIMRCATKTLGRLAIPGGPTTTEFVRFEVKKAIEWLHSVNKNENKKHASVLIITALAENAPIVLYEFIGQILEYLWIPLRDSNLVIRIDSAIALEKCLKILRDRNVDQCDTLIKSLLDLSIVNIKKCDLTNSNQNHSFASFSSINTTFNAVSCTNVQSYELIHSSLLMLRELLKYNNNSYIKLRFELLFEIAITYKNHSLSFIRQEIINLIPLICKINKDLFIKKYLHSTFVYFLAKLKKYKNQHTKEANSDKSAIFGSIGLILIQIGDNVITYLDAILENIKDCLSFTNNLSLQNIHGNSNPEKSSVSIGNVINSISSSASNILRFKTNRKEIEFAIFDCIGKLSITLGHRLAKHLENEIIDMMFLNCSLSGPIRNVLQTIITCTPALADLINFKLLNLLSLILFGKHFQIVGSPYNLTVINEENAKEHRINMISRETGTNVSSILLNQETYKHHDSIILIEALESLTFFEFKNYQLSEFVSFCTLKYLEHENNLVRKVALRSSCKIFTKDPICQQTSINSLTSVDLVLKKILTVSITDLNPEIRLEGLTCLFETNSFEFQLSQPQCACLLFIALNDESFEVKKIAIRIISRLSLINPAYIVPLLRKVLILLLSKISYSNSNRQREENSDLISLLVSNSKNLTKPYIKPIVKTLLSITKKQRSSVVSNIMCCLGELSIVGGEDFIQFIPEIMKSILETFQDQSSSYKKDVVLKTLGQILSSTGYVIQPLLDYPQLLGLLVNILKLETSQSVKREAVKLIGILGALDPYKLCEVEKNLKNDNVEQNAPPVDISLLMQGMSPSNCEYYPIVVTHLLMKILKDTSLNLHHTKVIQAIMYIFQTLGLRIVFLLPQIIPRFLNVLKTCQPNMVKFYFQHLGFLFLIVKKNIRPFLKEIFEVIKEFFNLSTLLNIQVVLINLIISISKALEDEFKNYLSDVLLLLLNVFDKDKSANREPSLCVLKSFVTFGSNIEEHIHLIISTIVKMFEVEPLILQIAAIETVGLLTKNVHFSEMSSLIIHPIIRVLNQKNAELTKVCFKTLSYLLILFKSEFIVFVPLIKKNMINLKITELKFEKLVNKVINSDESTIHYNTYIDEIFDEIDFPTLNLEKLPPKLIVDQSVLKITWDSTHNESIFDWQEWLSKLSRELIKQSPSHAIRACSNIVSDYYTLAKDLFNTSFASCWDDLSPENQKDLIKSFCNALSSPNIPPEIHQILLNLAEFMEHYDKPLPISISSLGQYAQRCHAYTKALHYKELEFFEDPTASTIESLMEINNQLQQTDAAIGILKHVQSQFDVQLKETWYEKLQRWDDALLAYSEKEILEPNNIEVIMGKMRCLHALGEWEQLSELARNKWDGSSTKIKKLVAPLAAAASWGLGQWERVIDYVKAMNSDSPDKSFFNAVLSLHKNQFEESISHITNARNLLIPEITALVSESYTRAYDVFVRVQMLSELEEIIQYKKLPQNSDKKILMKKTWDTRLLGCERNVDIWQRILKVRSLVIKPKEDMKIWLKFANLCRKSGKFNFAENSLNLLLDVDFSENPFNADPKVVYSQLKFMWTKGEQKKALSLLFNFTKKLSKDLKLDLDNILPQTSFTERNTSNDYNDENIKLLARCFLKQGEWKIILNKNWKEKNYQEILHSYFLATHFDKNWYKAWHNWALANFEVIFYCNSQNKNQEDSHDLNKYINKSFYNEKFMDENDTIDQIIINDNQPNILHDSGLIDSIKKHVQPAIKGFFYSISLLNSNSLQDTLRLLTLWFKFGFINEVSQSMIEGINMVKIDNWITVIPQLISRIHQPNQNIRRTLLGLLTDLGKAHPQALVYPLGVAITSKSINRKKAAQSIIEKMRLHSSNLVDQSELVSNELIRVAVLWHEQWYEGLEDASRFFFAENNVEKMLEVLESLHKMLIKGPETIRESSFINAYGRELADSYEWIRSYKTSKNITCLNQAWEIYYNVFRRISHQLPQSQSLELLYVSPKLEDAQDLELAVPGTYQAGKPVIKISRFDPIFSIISSKQRPRKFSCKGSDGKDYQYALKGHEDIRQDNLVMQLFGLLNTLLIEDPECFKRHLDIQQYSAIPLSPHVGLLGWVSNSDTFHVLIRKYRESKKISLNIEHRLMLQMALDYDNLTLLQKVEVFTKALNNTQGDDLYRVLWLKSKSSEAWLERRTTYTRSLAVMSMTGYILGLGDRHPSNLMLHRITGKVIHIDFGDCFEAAILREKYPEKVPFRLTRMLSSAMEVSGIEGSFRITCGNVMSVIRENKDSLMALLEAFAYDPLINWGFDLPTKKIEETTGIKIPNINTIDLLRKGQITEKEAANLTWKNELKLKNARAKLVLKRINEKLTGNDIKKHKDLDVNVQVEKLIEQAKNVENLCQHYIGWCPFW